MSYSIGTNLDYLKLKKIQRESIGLRFAEKGEHIPYKNEKFRLFKWMGEVADADLLFIDFVENVAYFDTSAR